VAVVVELYGEFRDTTTAKTTKGDTETLNLA